MTGEGKRSWYPDVADVIPRRTIVPGSSGGWQRADVELIAATRRVLGEAGHVTGLDVGAGTGRLFPALARNVDTFLAVERDPRRAAVAARVAREHPECAGVLVADLLTDDIGAGFDLLICSHVVQHVRPVERTTLFERLRMLLRPGGVGLLTYPTTGRTSSAHYLSSMDAEGMSSTLLVDEDRFTAAFSIGDLLPVWHAGISEVDSAVMGCGFDVLESGSYRDFRHLVRFPIGAQMVLAYDAFVIARVAS